MIRDCPERTRERVLICHTPILVVDEEHFDEMVENRWRLEEYRRRQDCCKGSSSDVPPLVLYRCRSRSSDNNQRLRATLNA